MLLDGCIFHLAKVHRRTLFPVLLMYKLTANDSLSIPYFIYCVNIFLGNQKLFLIQS